MQRREKMATLKDVAAELGLSPSTISRALAGHSHVDEMTRSSILSAAERLGYRPNAIARALRRQSTHTIGLVVPSIVNDFFALSGTAIQLAAERSGFQVILCQTSDDPQREIQYLEVLASHNAAGIILSSCTDQSVGTPTDQVPVVELARRSSSGRRDFAGAADRDGTEELTHHLIGLGHRRIGIVTGSLTFSPARDRVTGYKRAVEVAGIDVEEGLIMPANPSKEWGQEATKNLLARPKPPTAIVATGTQLVLGAFEALKDAGLSCPEDVSVVGFEDPPWFAIWQPGITAYASPMREIGFAAWQLLLRRMHNEIMEGEESSVTRLSGRLRVRGSSRQLTSW